jgi:hypothetical protein
VLNIALKTLFYNYELTIIPLLKNKNHKIVINVISYSPH